MRLIITSWEPGVSEGSFTEEMVFEWVLEEDRNEGGLSGQQNRGMEYTHTYIWENRRQHM